MKNTSLLMICAVAVLAALTSGCLWAPDLDRVRKELEEQLPGAEFKREFAISLGPLSLALARGVVNFVPEAREARGYLRDVHSVRVAIYEIEDVPRNFDIKMPRQLDKLLAKNEWELAAKVHDDGDKVWVMYREDGGSVKELYVVVMDGNELVLARVQGRMDRILERAMEDDFDVHCDLGIDIR